MMQARKRLNDFVREKGNEILPDIGKIIGPFMSGGFRGIAYENARQRILPNHIFEAEKEAAKEFSYGLGDFLTQKVTFRKIGGTIGVVSPYVLMSVTKSDWAALSMILTLPLGYMAGVKIDEKVRKDYNSLYRIISDCYKEDL